MKPLIPALQRLEFLLAQEASDIPKRSDRWDMPCSITV